MQKQHFNSTKAIIAMTDHALQNSADQILLVGPVLWQLKHGRKNIFVSNETGKGAGSTFIDCGKSDQLACDIRSKFVGAAACVGKPFVIQLFEDELDMAQTAAALWPSDKFQKIVRNIEEERKSIGNVSTALH